MITNLQGKTFQSVLKDWVCDLPLRQEGTLLTAIRGCDLTPKYPLNSIERTLTAFIRCAVMNAFDAREIDSEQGCFMQTKVPDFKASALGHYPHHWVMHVLHAIEIIAYCCPEINFSSQATDIYNNLIKSMHVNPETVEEMKERLSEDRIAKGCIVE